jgi:hypothetical protein
MSKQQLADAVHEHSRLLTELKGQLGKMQNSQDAVEAMLSQAVLLPKDLLDQIEEFIGKNARLGFVAREDFLKDAARFRLRYLSQEYEHVELPRKKTDRGEELIGEAELPFLGVADFLEQQLDALLKRYEEWQGRRRK